MSWNRSIEWEFETKSTLANEVDLSMEYVITLCDYGTCPTIKSNNAINTIVVVKFGGNLRSSEAGRNSGDHDYYEPFENCAVGVLLE